MDDKVSVQDYLKSQNKDAKLTDYVRFELGEGIEKKEEDFAAEVAKPDGLISFKRFNFQPTPFFRGVLLYKFITNILKITLYIYLPLSSYL